MPSTNETRYILYSHWGVGNSVKDIDDWENNGRDATWLNQQKVVRLIQKASQDLENLLEKTRGQLVLFFDPGWKLVLKAEFERSHAAELARAQAYAQSVDNQHTGIGAARIQLLTTQRLQEFVKELRERDRAMISRWFVGEKGFATYDSPKIIEAFLRVRLLGSGIPILRIDWDALINTAIDGEYEKLGVGEDAIAECLKRAEEDRAGVHVRTWISSAGYEKPTDNSYRAWSRGFATRIQPALLATPEMCRLVRGWNFGLLEPDCSLDASQLELDAESLVGRCFDQQRAVQYLGVEEQGDSWLMKSGEDNIATLGAHPLHAVISGALLNLSASAIIDLPPFSNMTRGVMWIDDHLKFELHKALGHLKHLRHVGNKSCRLEKWVVKGRAPVTPNLAAYTWAQYLPTLLRGLVMDSWIRKEREDEEEDRPLVGALKEAITKGDYDHRAGMKLEKKLHNVAIERISRVHRAWSGLMDGRTHTLASAWATSQVGQLVTANNRSADLNQNSSGFGLIADDADEINTISDLRPPIQNELLELIWDAIDYIHFTLHWPGMIQTIRSVERELIRA